MQLSLFNAHHITETMERLNPYGYYQDWKAAVLDSIRMSNNIISTFFLATDRPAYYERVKRALEINGVLIGESWCVKLYQHTVDQYSRVLLRQNDALTEIYESMKDNEMNGQL